ncbi:MAG: hypothetical protein ACRBM6_35895 [Geminicoccales bacterium]
MYRKATEGCNWIVVVLFGTTLAIVGSPELLAAEKCQRKLDNSGAESSYTEQHVLDVGDEPDHQIRLFELHRVYQTDEPNCEGLKRKESWAHGYSDYVDRNGRAWGYTTIIYDNGDKIFGQFSGTSHTVTLESGEKKSTYVGVVKYTGGTGVYQGVQGVARDNIQFDPIANVNISESEEEYTIAK